VLTRSRGHSLSGRAPGRHTGVVSHYLSFLLVGAAIAGYWVWNWNRRKERPRLWPASSSGMSYSQNDPYDLPAYGFFRLFGEGNGRGCENVLSGRWRDQPVKEADYWYYTQTTTSKGTSRN
jgi:hypothetical protein